MKEFNELTPLGQVRRLRVLAKNALHAYSLETASFHQLQHGENTTFRVDIPGDNQIIPSAIYHPKRYLLRVHRSGYQNEASIASELMWLAALRQADLPVPEPIPNQNGDLYTVSQAPGVPEPRVCSLLRWMKGRFYENKPQPHHISAVGRLMAHMHTQSETWQAPSGFNRRSWDGEGLFGDNCGFNLPKEEVWSLVPAPYAKQFRAVVEKTSIVMTALDTSPNARGLIHADLHLGNVLFARDPATGRLEARPIDFDDCGYAHWVYDFAAVIGNYITEDDYPAYHDALLSGYSEIRPLPVRQLEHLNTFIAARLVSLMLWATDMAQVNKGFGPGLPGWYTWASEGITRCMKA